MKILGKDCGCAERKERFKALVQPLITQGKLKLEDLKNFRGQIFQLNKTKE